MLDQEAATGSNLPGVSSRPSTASRSIPEFVPHSGEIAGAWIRSDERFTNPRLTQRLLFG